MIGNHREGTLRRVIIYLFHDAQGIVDEYVTYKLKALRPFAEHIFVVANSSLTAASRDALEEVADTVWARENKGFDVWGYKESLQAFGIQRLAAYDEVILMNYTFLGPIYPFAETFEKMDAQPDLDFWGMTAHKADHEHPVHLQSHWIAIRRSMFMSMEFARYWQDMPMITSYSESIYLHESRFTQHFADRGFTFAVTFDPDDYPAPSPIFENAQLMLDDRCPIIKRRLFFHESSYLERKGILGRELMEKVATESEYPVDLIWRDVVRFAEPRILYTNFTLLDIVPDFVQHPEVAPTPRICVLAHIYYDDMTDEMMGMIENIPVPYDIVVTTTDATKKANIEAALARYDLRRAEVRIVQSNRGRAESAFLITCQDVLTSGDYDLILKVHSKKSPQDGHNLGYLFKHHSMDNLLNSKAYVANLLATFEQDPTVGMIFPPVVQIGFPTIGHAWFTNREPAKQLADTLGVKTPFDRSTPIAAYGGMFWARPESLLKLTSHAFTFEDFGTTDNAYADGLLGHVVERLWAYTAMDAGFTARSAMTTRWAAVNYAFLEYKLDRVAAMLAGYTEEQVAVINTLASNNSMDGNLLYHLKRVMDIGFPRLGRVLRPAYRVARGARALTARR